jgi:hypothetical protein
MFSLLQVPNTKMFKLKTPYGKLMKENQRGIIGILPSYSVRSRVDKGL